MLQVLEGRLREGFGKVAREASVKQGGVLKNERGPQSKGKWGETGFILWICKHGGEDSLWWA